MTDLVAVLGASTVESGAREVGQGNRSVEWGCGKIRWPCQTQALRNRSEANR